MGKIHCTLHLEKGHSTMSESKMSGEDRRVISVWITLRVLPMHPSTESRLIKYCLVVDDKEKGSSTSGSG